MTSITLEGDVVTGERLIHEVNLNKAVPCELEGIHALMGTPLGEAEWRIFWNEGAPWCKCHVPVPWTLACTPCKAAILDAAGIQCIHCWRVVSIGTAIRRIDAL